MEPPAPLTTAPTLSHMTTSTILHGAAQVAPGQFSSSSALASQEVKPNVEPQDVQGVKPFPIAAQHPRPPTAQAGLTTAFTTTGLGGLGQVAQNVTQNTFNSGASISGTSDLVAQSISSVNANITGAQGVPGLGQSLAGLGHGLATTSQMGQTGTGINQGGLPGIPAIGVNVAAGTMVPKPSQPVQLGLQGLGAVNGAGNNVQFQNEYVKVWEGVLGGSRQGKSVPICKLEAYQNRTSSESVGADWPSTMQIIRLISQDHITSKDYEGKHEYLVFRNMTHHGFLQQLAEKKLLAVIQLPSQTLLLYSSDKPGRMIGMLLPGELTS